MAYKERPLKYPDLDAIRQLRNSGRELLGTFLYATEKRDGSNMCIWVSETLEETGLPGSGVGFLHSDIHISSRNMDTASTDLVNQTRAAKSYKGVEQMLKDNPTWVVFAESIPAGVGPTRLEPKHKNPDLIVFDIWEGGKFFSYNYMYQQCYHYHVPVVKLIGQGTFESMDTLGLWVKDLLKYSKRHRREGVVIKAYGLEEQVFAKEKIDLPERPKLVHDSGNKAPDLPPLPDSEIYGAIDKVLADHGMDFLRDKRQAMPKVAEYV